VDQSICGPLFEPRYAHGSVEEDLTITKKTERAHSYLVPPEPRLTISSVAMSLMLVRSTIWIRNVFQRAGKQLGSFHISTAGSNVPATLW